MLQGAQRGRRSLRAVRPRHSKCSHGATIGTRDLDCCPRPHKKRGGGGVRPKEKTRATSTDRQPLPPPQVNSSFTEPPRCAHGLNPKFPKVNFYVVSPILRPAFLSAAPLSLSLRDTTFPTAQSPNLNTSPLIHFSLYREKVRSFLPMNIKDS